MSRVRCTYPSGKFGKQIATLAFLASCFLAWMIEERRDRSRGALCHSGIPITMGYRNAFTYHRNMHQTSPTALLLLVVAHLAIALPTAGAFAPSAALSVTTPTTATSTSLHMAQMGPVARAKKMANPKEYNRIVEQKMEMDGLTRQQAEAEYNQFLENPPFYYALDKKADCT